MEDIVLSPICKSIASRVVSAQKSAIFKTISDEKVRDENLRQLKNQLSDPIHCIKNRTNYGDNPIFNALQAAVIAMLNKYYQ